MTSTALVAKNLAAGNQAGFLLTQQHSNEQVQHEKVKLK
jgi:hypothetical protein